MKSSRLFLLAALLCAIAAPSRSQNAEQLPAIATPVISTNTWHSIPILHVKPSTMASWLNSYAQSSTEMGASAPSQPLAENSAFKLPTGVEAVAPVDKQKVLLVLGTPKGVENIARLVAFFDRPLRQVEIEARFVEGKGEDFNALFRKLGLATAKDSPASATHRGFLRVTSLSQIEAEIKAGRLKIVSMPRVVAVNNTTVNVNQTTSQSAVVGVLVNNGKFQPLPGMVAPTALTVETTRGFEVTPTINNDDSVTMLINAPNSTHLRAKDEKATLPLESRNGLRTIVNVRDGETVALSSSGGSLILVTARIVRRADG